MRKVQYKGRWKILVVAILFTARLASPPAARAASDTGFYYEVVGNTASVTGCVEYPCPTDLEIPATLGAYVVTSVGNYAFAFEELTSVSIPDSVTTIGDGAFAYSSLTFVAIPEFVTTIGVDAFAGNALTSVTIPEFVTTISEDAFFGNALTEVIIPASVMTIGPWAFALNSLSSVTFLGNAPSDGGSVFYGNSDLTSILRSVDATGWGAFWSDLPVETPVETVDEFRFRIADGVATVIGCDGTCPTNLVIPADLDGYVVMHIDASAFYGSALEFLTLPSSITTIGDEAFAWNLLTTVTIPNSVTSIGDDAFAGNLLTTVTIPNSVTSIGAGAFSTNALTTVTIPNSVTTIGASAFYSNALTTVTIGNSVTSIGDDAFAGNLLTTVTIPNSVTTIGDDAFAGNSLTSVTIPNSVTSIGAYAFFGNLLTTVTIPNSVTTIGDGAFAWNLLTTVTIPNSVTSIGSNAFADNLLNTVTFFGNAPVGGRDVFGGNSSLARVSRYKGTAGWGSRWGGLPIRILVADLRAFTAVKPRITGTATSGRTLTAAKGTWSGYPSPTFTYRWYACTTVVSAASATVPSTCKKIAGATRSTFKLTSAQRGKYVAVFVTGKSLRTTATSWLSKTTSKVK